MFKVVKKNFKEDAKLTCTEMRRACHEIKVNDSKAGLDQNKSKSQNPQVACQPDSDTHPFQTSIESIMDDISGQEALWLQEIESVDWWGPTFQAIYEKGVQDDFMER